MDMLDINLVPKDLRRKKKRSLLPGGFSIPLEVVLGVGGGVFLLLILVHVLLLFVNFSKFQAKKKLQSEWQEILPAKEKTDAVISKMRGLQSRKKDIEKITQRDFFWARKMNIISDKLPKGVWLRKISLRDDMFIIEGSAISRKKEEMISVHHLASKLKEDEAFMKAFRDMELGSIQMRKIKTTEIADFSIRIQVQ